MARSCVRSRRMLLAACVAVALCASLHAPIALAQDGAEPTPTTEAPTPDTPTVTDAPTTDPPTEAPTEAPTPTPTPSETPAVTSSSASGSDSTDSSASKAKSSSSSTSGSLATTSKTPSSTRTPRPTTDTPSTTTATTTTRTPTPTQTSSADSNNSTKSESGNNSKTIAIIAVSGIAGVCALGLLVVCFLRRSRDDYDDDLASPLPQFHQQQSTANAHQPNNNRGSIPMGAGAANYYPAMPKSSFSGAPQGKESNRATATSVTSPTAPSSYRPSNRLTNISRKSSRAKRPTETNNSFVAANISPLESRLTGASEISSFTVSGDSVLNGSEPRSSVDIVDRSTYNSRYSASTNEYRFTATSSLSSLHDNSEGLDSVVNRGCSASSVDRQMAEDEELSQSIGGTNARNWYDPVDSPSAASNPRYTSGSDTFSRDSTDRQSFEL